MARLALLLLLVVLQACATTRQLPASSSASTERSAPVKYARPVQEPAASPAKTPVSDQRPAPKPDPAPTQPPPPPKRPPHPLAGMTEDKLEKKLLEDPKALGSISIGRTNAGSLFNGVQMPKGPYWQIVNPAETWGTRETVEALARCITRVNKEHANTPRIRIGDISLRPGGHFPPHLSHQSGRDVDLGFYYTTAAQWYTHAGKKNLDLPRTWTLVKAIITETDVEVIFLDTSIQKLLKEHALSVGENPTWLDSIFGGPLSTDRPLVRYSPGHATHLHIRFFNPIAQQTGRRMYKLLLAHNKIKPPTYYVRHKVRRGDTLIRLARRYKTTVRAIKRANGLRSSRIITNRRYKIPQRGGVAQVDELVLPARRQPPQERTSASHSVAAPEP